MHCYITIAYFDSCMVIISLFLSVCSLTNSGVFIVITFYLHIIESETIQLIILL